jgi:predicted nucleotidyltransferase
MYPVADAKAMIAAQLPSRDVLRAACAAAFSGVPVFLVYAYGSRVGGCPRPDSDLDLGYYLRREHPRRCLGLREELDLAGSLSDALGLEVDLRCLGGAPLEVRGRVLEQGLRVYCDDEVARVGLERDLLGDYHDYKNKLALWRQLRLAALAARRS